MKLIYGILFLIALFCNAAYATHFKGGEILAKHISGQTYAIKVRLYLDTQVGAGAADAMNNVTICLGNGVTKDLSKTQVIAHPNNGSVLIADFEGQYTYPVSGIFQISTSIDNRTAGYLNLERSEMTSAFLWTVVDTQVQNSTPVLPYLNFEAGVKQVFSVDLAPTVADTDSVSIKVHKLSKASPGTCGVRMIDNRYLFPNEITGNGTFKIDLVSRKLVWTAPELVGNYLFAMLVTEWRAGVIISESYREGSIAVVDKPGPPVEIPPYESAEFGNPVTSIPKVSSPEISMALEAFPVPTEDFVTVKAYSKNRAVIRLQLVDMNGRILREISSKTPVISVQERFDLRNMAHGIYLIRADNATHSATQKVVR